MKQQVEIRDSITDRDIIEDGVLMKCKGPLLRVTIGVSPNGAPFERQGVAISRRFIYTTAEQAEIAMCMLAAELYDMIGIYAQEHELDPADLVADLMARKQRMMLGQRVIERSDIERSDDDGV